MPAVQITYGDIIENHARDKRHNSQATIACESVKQLEKRFSASEIAMLFEMNCWE
ncbi:hypothetical protein PCO31010_04557 [Pandoraea commovens]|uniref:Uncharacterized protein n=1 Tax=Pandoraea commovens TaxID=2508289 RepID=A0A5E4YI13_9BURK|nr:hypothetical protein PCO31010_04557 [Pandoraea commovens]